MRWLRRHFKLGNPFYDENWACRSTWNVRRTSGNFSAKSEYCPPVWPEEPGVQQQMAHLDFAVNDLEERFSMR